MNDINKSLKLIDELGSDEYLATGARWDRMLPTNDLKALATAYREQEVTIREGGNCCPHCSCVCNSCAKCGDGIL
jgi:hypothetical protein